MLNRVRFVVPMLLAVCSSIHAQEATFQCQLPPGIKEHTPLINLAPSDTAGETLAREFIELERRKKINEGSWYLASSAVLTQERMFAALRGNLANDREKVERWRRAERRTNAQLFDKPLDQIVHDTAIQFRKTCKDYIEANREYEKREGALGKIRNEKKKPWLAPDRKLPCDIQSRPGCAA